MQKLLRKFFQGRSFPEEPTLTEVHGSCPECGEGVLVQITLLTPIHPAVVVRHLTSLDAVHFCSCCGRSTADLPGAGGTRQTLKKVIKEWVDVYHQWHRLRELGSRVDQSENNIERLEQEIERAKCHP